MNKVSIAFVDDHPILLEGLVRLFSARSDYAVVGSGKCGSDAIDLATTTRPDVLVVDLNMPGNVFEAIEKIGEIGLKTKIVAFTASPGVDDAMRALEAGVAGYVLKGGTVDDLCNAIKGVLKGETFIPPALSTKVISGLRNAALQKAAVRAIKLSVREDQIVRLLLRGRTNREISLQLQIGEKTVKHYMTLLMQKLRVGNRLEVIIAAQRLGEEYRVPRLETRLP